MKTAAPVPVQALLAHKLRAHASIEGSCTDAVCSSGPQEDTAVLDLHMMVLQEREGGDCQPRLPGRHEGIAQTAASAERHVPARPQQVSIGTPVAAMCWWQAQEPCAVQCSAVAH